MRIERAARDRHAPFVGVWLDVDPDLLWRRVDQRRGGPSDATVEILSRQLERDIGEITWLRLDATRKPTAIVSDILTLPATSSMTVRDCERY
jgi:predicted kinase